MADSLPPKLDEPFYLMEQFASSSQDTSETPFINTQELLDRCMGNIEFAERILTKFVQRFDDDVLQLEKEIETRDAEKIWRFAHRLKGTAATVSACRLMRILDDIEKLGRKNDVSEIPVRLDELHFEWSRFQAQVTS